MKLRVGTRRSPLARLQTDHVCAMLGRADPRLVCEVLAIQTTGDSVRDRPLREIGGKGLFVKELDEALLDGRIDCAVHSLKDVPSELVDGIELACIPERLDPCDVLITLGANSISELASNATLGTTSLRRGGQALAVNGGLRVAMLRGNVETRLARVRERAFDATLLASAGLKRLGVRLDGLRVRHLDPWTFVPAAGQGALAVTIRSDDAATRAAIRAIHVVDVGIAIDTERAVARALGGSCDLPLGVYARVRGAEIEAVAVVVANDGAEMLRREGRVPLKDAETLARDLAEKLRDDGAMRLLAPGAA